jgi:amidase
MQAKTPRPWSAIWLRSPVGPGSNSGAANSARARAAAADEALARGEIWGPLHGLPMTIKDAYEVKGLRTTGGSPEYKDHVPARSATAVERIERAGAVIFGKTNVPFLSGDLQTFNEIYGTTNNPWNLACVPGGSSGGSAAASAAGLTAAELGSDIGGSIRTPAHFCGVFGHKSTFGIVPKRGHITPPPGHLAEGDLSVAGPLGRSAEDLDLLLSVVAGPDDIKSAGWNLDLAPPRATSAKDLRVAVWIDDPFCEIDAESAALLKNAAKVLEDAGAKVDWNARPDFTLEWSNEVYLTLPHSITASRFPDGLKQRLVEMSAQLPADDKSHLSLQARGASISYADRLIWQEHQARLMAAWADFFRDYDVVLAPVLMRPAFPHDQQSNWHKRRLIVNGKEREYFDVLTWAGPAMVSHLPASVAPVGITSEGLPVGVQIIGPHFGDRTTIAVAGMLEEML